ncbi:MAG: hypothetical protein HC875_32600 [Anaerolineales bacterium]|nr:hypothetical protein [Anaerolineales bacterium]
MVKPSKAEIKILRALADGVMLKSHRYLDGTKIYQLHSLAGEVEPVPKRLVDELLRRGYITSNQKFPAATYSLTEPGRAVAAQASQVSHSM